MTQPRKFTLSPAAALRRSIDAYLSSFQGLHQSTWILAAGALINALGGSVNAFLALYLTRHFNITLAEASPILVIGGVGLILGSFLSGFACDKVAPKIILVTAMAVPAVIYAAMPFVTDLRLFAAMNFTALFMGGAYRPAYQVSIVTYSGGRTVLSKGYALYRVAINLGIAAGGSLAAFLIDTDARLVFWVNASTNLMIAVWLATMLRMPSGPDRDQGKSPGLDARPGGESTPVLQDPSFKGPGSPWRDQVFLALCLITLVQTTIFFQLNGSFSVYLVDVMNQPTTLYGLLISINCLMIVFLEVPLVHATQRTDPFVIAAAGMLATGLGFGVLVWQGGGFLLALGSCLLWTVGEMLFFPGAVRLVGMRAPSARMGAFLGIYQTMSAIGRALAPGIGGLLYDVGQGRLLWWVCLGLGPVGAGLIVILAHRLRQKMTVL